ncbi:unnamed protein product [Alopecurus aequalis]
MAGKEGKLVLGRCTAGRKAATCDETSTKHTLRGCTAHHKSATDGERCTTEPMEVSREGALLKRKAEEEIFPHPDQEQEKAMAVPMAAILHNGPDVVSVAAAGEAAEPKAAVPQPLAEGANLEAVSEHQAEGAIKEAVSGPDAYEDDYQDDAEYDDDVEDDYYYDEEEDYDYDDEDESQIEEQRPEVKAMLQSFPEAASLKPQELDDAVERVLEQSKPEYENMAATGKIRLLREDVKLAVADNSWFYDDQDQNRKQFRAKVRKELIEKGYVEVDEDYYDKKYEYEQQTMKKIEEEWNQMMGLIDRSRFGDGIRYYSEEHGGYI